MRTLSVASHAQLLARQVALIPPTKGRARIENWRAVPDKKNPKYLLGQVSYHARQSEFKIDTQQTSRIVSFDFSAAYVETLNTIYTLGTEAKLLEA